MKITFVSEFPIHQKNSFSGVPFYMGQELQMQSDGYIGIEIPRYHPENLLRGEYDRFKAELVHSGRYLTEQLKKVDTDVVVCSGASMIPFLETDRPVVLWHDSIWFGLYRQFMDFKTFQARYPLLCELDQMTFEKCDLLVFASEWIREISLQNYAVSPEKVHVIPFGANIEPDRAIQIEDLVSKRINTPCQLTFIGKEWERKGLPLALDVTERLNSLGLPTELNVIGCAPHQTGRIRQIAHAVHLRTLCEAEKFALRYHASKHVNRIGFLDKEDPSQYRQFEEYLARSHFLIHPASFEHYGIVMAEANAYGVPILAVDCYGPKTIVRSGVNGYLFAQDEFVEKATQCIQAHMCDDGLYRRLAQNAYYEFLNRLNWPTSVRRLKQLVAEQHPVAPV